MQPLIYLKITKQFFVRSLLFTRNVSNAAMLLITDMPVAITTTDVRRNVSHTTAKKRK
jgi:hypothetical protein